MLLPLVVLWSCIVANASATLARGAAERLLYYGAYLLEEYDDASDNTIAPDCVGSRDGGRCTFDEFLRYIWAPKPGQSEADRPKPGLFIFPPSKRPFVYGETKLFTMFQIIMSGRKSGVDMTLWIDSHRLVPRAADFYEAHRLAARPVAKAKTQLASMPVFTSALRARKQAIQDIYTRTKDAANAVVELRIKDYDLSHESGRLRWFADELGFKPEVKQGGNTAKVAGDYKIFSAVRTMKANPGKEEAIKAAMAKFKVDTKE